MPACLCHFKRTLYGCVFELHGQVSRVLGSTTKLVYKHQSFGFGMGRLYLSQHATEEAFLSLKAFLNGLWCGHTVVSAFPPATHGAKIPHY